MKFDKKRKDENYEMVKVKEKTKPDQTQLCVWIDSKQYKKLKIRAAMDSTTIKDIICNNINIYLNK
jgi:hypothetical protein